MSAKDDLAYIKHTSNERLPVLFIDPNGKASTREAMILHQHILKLTEILESLLPKRKRRK